MGSGPLPSSHHGGDHVRGQDLQPRRGHGAARRDGQRSRAAHGASRRGYSRRGRPGRDPGGDSHGPRHRASLRGAKPGSRRHRSGGHHDGTGDHRRRAHAHRGGRGPNGGRRDTAPGDHGHLRLPGRHPGDGRCPRRRATSVASCDTRRTSQARIDRADGAAPPEVWEVKPWLRSADAAAWARRWRPAPPRPPRDPARRRNGLCPPGPRCPPGAHRSHRRSGLDAPRAAA